MDKMIKKRKNNEAKCSFSVFFNNDNEAVKARKKKKKRERQRELRRQEQKRKPFISSMDV